MPIKQGIVEYFGVTGSEHTCGYCKAMKPADCDYGMWAHQLKPQEYLLLMERGWRRSGKYCYHPIRSKTCCPPYAIRCIANDFTLSKSQKKCLKRVNRFLSDGVIPRDKHRIVSDHNSDPMRVETIVARPDLIVKQQHEPGNHLGAEAVSDAAPPADLCPGTTNNVCGSTHAPNPHPKPLHSKTKDHSQKAKSKRIAKRVERLMNRQKCSQEDAERLVRQKHENKVLKEREQQHQQLEKLLRADPNAKHRIEVKIIRTSFDQDNSITADSKKQSCFNETILPLEYSVYSRYQVSIHKDDPNECTVKQYKRFLCETPLMFSPFRQGLNFNEVTGYGSYHMQYWIDSDKLIAVSVIDILSTGLSSVYLFYDPDYSFLGLGTYTAIRELDLVRSMSRKMTDFQYYYMGFYINSCPKMRYKSKYRPSQLLCPEVRTWHPIEQAVKLLNLKKYSRLEPDGSIPDQESQGITDQMISIVMPGVGITSYHHYRTLKSQVVGEHDDDDDEPDPVHDVAATDQKVKEYASLVGKAAVKSILIYLE